MENLFSKRFTELLNEHRYTYSQLIEKLNLKSKGTITKYANGQIENVGISTVVKIANLYNVSPIWLIGLIDDKYFDPDIQVQYSRIPIIKHPNELNNISKCDDSNSIIILSSLASTNNYIATTCLDDSMYPMFYKDDIVIVKKQSAYKNNQIYLIDNNNEFLIRKIEIKKDKICLIPINKDYKSLTYSKSDMQKNGIKIIGIIEKIERNKLK